MRRTASIWKTKASLRRPSYPAIIFPDSCLLLFRYDHEDSTAVWSTVGGDFAGRELESIPQDHATVGEVEVSAGLGGEIGPILRQ
ncbi:hypothetical protein OAA19_00020 [Rubripirellula sp.]|nr:hypothetical protein [Rubripirellula sp.]MDB4338471.1 hypothetical protein [Rubripirellula sp.]